MNENMINNYDNESKEKNLSFGEFLFLIKRNIILVLIITFVATAISGVYGLFFKSYSYTATTATIVMVDSSKDTTRGNNEYTNYMYSTYLINTFKDFILSKKVINTAISDLNKYRDVPLNLGYESIKNNIKVSNGENSLYVSISYTAHGNDKEQEAIDIINAVINAAVRIVNTEKKEDQDELKYEILSRAIGTVDPADEAVGKRGAALIIIIGFLVGLVISFLIVLFIYLTDDTYKSKEEFERVFGINVLSSIPDLTDIKEEKGDKNNEK